MKCLIVSWRVLLSSQGLPSHSAFIEPAADARNRTQHTHTHHSSILCTYRGQNVIQAAHPSVIPPHGGRCTDCKYHSHTQLHVSKKHTSDKPPSIIPHLQQTTSPFP